MAARSGILQRLPKRVSIYEVSLRDGLQNEAMMLPLESKVALAAALLSTGLTRIELTSFVSPKWIPQLADADEFVRAVAPPPGVIFSALVPNAKGLERARAAGLGEIAVFMSASETHNRKNTNRGIEGSLEAFLEVVPPAVAQGMRVRAYVSTVWGCPYEGDVDPRRALEISRRLLELGCYQVSLGDTIGVGTPRQTEAILGLFLDELPPDKLALHLHDTRGTALPNVLVGLDMGIRDFDSAIGGLGGCPYAPGAAGNVATEDLVYMLHGMGIETGTDLERLVAAGQLAEKVTGRALPGKVHRAGASIRRRAGP
ncbi:MAG TPA: hydroxymethylglutaryl-CoA lyase [Polyangiaceae bacterium]|nr:hydroxymethylglutaryl-CoA lyase [Polyangiaceae bacterium]